MPEGRRDWRRGGSWHQQQPGGVESHHRRCAAGPSSPTQAPSSERGRQGRQQLRLGATSGLFRRQAGEGAYREAGIAGLDPELCQHPDAVGELQGLVEHVLALHVPLGDGEDVAALELAANGICAGGESCCGGCSEQGTGLTTSSLWTCSCPFSSSPPSPHPAMQHIQNPPSPHSEKKGFYSTRLPGPPRGGQATAQSSIHKRSCLASLHKGQLAAASGTERIWLSLPRVWHVLLGTRSPGEGAGGARRRQGAWPRLLPTAACSARKHGTAALPVGWPGQVAVRLGSVRAA